MSNDTKTLIWLGITMGLLFLMPFLVPIVFGFLILSEFYYWIMDYNNSSSLLDEDRKPTPRKPSPNTPGYSYNLKKKQQYLASPKWDIKRKACLKRSNYLCDMCDCSKPLEVHHLNYNSLYNEGDKDICSLCRDCHSKVHDIYGYKGNYFPLIRKETPKFFNELDI